jgi:hypothetical protein
MKLNLKGTGLSEPIYLESKGLADLHHEGLAPSTTDSMEMPIAVDDPDTVGEDCTSPATGFFDGNRDSVPVAAYEDSTRSSQRENYQTSSVQGVSNSGMATVPTGRGNKQGGSRG